MRLAGDSKGGEERHESTQQCRRGVGDIVAREAERDGRRGHRRVIPQILCSRRVAQRTRLSRHSGEAVL